MIDICCDVMSVTLVKKKLTKASNLEVKIGAFIYISIKPCTLRYMISQQQMNRALQIKPLFPPHFLSF